MINTGVPNDFLVPATFHTFTYLFANRSLVSLPMRIGLAGMKSAAGTAVASTVYEVVDATQTDGLFGVGSELAIMCRMAFACSAKFARGPRVYAVAIAEPGASVATTKTFTITGTATADGNIIVRAAGRTFVVGVRIGNVQNNIATALSNKIKEGNENNPFSTGVATNVVTITYPTTGVTGNDLAVEVVQTVAGVTVAAAAGVTGTGTPNIQGAIDAFATEYYDGLAFSTHVSADITIINTDRDSTWAATSKMWRWYFMGETGTIGTATTLAAAANHHSTVIGSYEGCPNLPGEIATALCMLAFSRSAPNANYDAALVPLYPPAAATAYTQTEKNTAILAGLTPLMPRQLSDGSRATSESAVVRMCTTKTTTTGSAPFYVTLDLGVSRTGVYIARQIDVAWEERAQGDPNGIRQTDDVLGQVGDTAKAIMRAAAEPGVDILRNVENDILKMLIERDLVTSGRTNVDLWYTVVVGQHQVAWKHNVQV